MNLDELHDPSFFRRLLPDSDRFREDLLSAPLSNSGDAFMMMKVLSAVRIAVTGTMTLLKAAPAKAQAQALVRVGDGVHPV
jgi:hypothetical protein